MIKKLLTVAALAVGCVSGFSQGTVVFGNNSTTLVTTNGPTSGNATVGNFILGIYAANGNVGSDSGLQLIGTYNLTSPGRFFFNKVTNDLVIPAGGIASFQIRAWSAGFGFTTYEAAVASGNPLAYAGKSALWSQDTANPADTFDITPAMTVGASGFNGLVLTPVPEPTTVAFGLLGLGALALVRRRK